MAGAWKTVLNEYVLRHNRMEALRSCEQLEGIVTDDSYIRRLTGIYDRLNKASGAYPLPIRCETKAKPDHIVEQDRLVTVRLRLSRRWTYQGDRVQERIEHERLSMTCRSGEWQVSRVDIYVPEKSRIADFTDDTTTDAGTLPYINRRLLNHRDLSARANRYNREAACRYADMWWNSANPKYHLFEVDCTNFVSQCLFAGGVPMNYTGRRNSGWWYEGYAGSSERWSYSWAVANSLQAYLLGGRSGQRGIKVNDPTELSPGDIISYDWDGDSRYTHTTIVTGFDSRGFPLVNAHTNDSRLRYWDYRDSYAWTSNTRYTFIHIPDTL